MKWHSQRYILQLCGICICIYREEINEAPWMLYINNTHEWWMTTIIYFMQLLGGINIGLFPWGQWDSSRHLHEHVCEATWRLHLQSILSLILNKWTPLCCEWQNTHFYYSRAGMFLVIGSTFYVMFNSLSQQILSSIKCAPFVLYILFVQAFLCVSNILQPYTGYIFWWRNNTKGLFGSLKFWISNV